MFETFYQEYKTAYVIHADYKANGRSTTVILEIRKGAKLGCELFTLIDGNQYQYFSRLLDGCLSQLLMGLSVDSQITIPYLLPVDAETGIQWISVNKTLFFKSDRQTASTNSTNLLSVMLTSYLDDKEIRTQSYEFENVYECINEFQLLLNRKGIKTMRVCHLCSFINYYSNSVICLRDLKPKEFVVARNKIISRLDISEYYKKIAWGIEELHHCSAFTKL